MFLNPTIMLHIISYHEKQGPDPQTLLSLTISDIGSLQCTLSLLSLPLTHPQVIVHLPHLHPPSVRGSNWLSPCSLWIYSRSGLSITDIPRSSTAALTELINMCIQVTHQYRCGHVKIDKAPCAVSKRTKCGVLNTRTVQHNTKCFECGGG